MYGRKSGHPRLGSGSFGMMVGEVVVLLCVDGWMDGWSTMVEPILLS